ncbi:MAG: hypothetical protein U0326_12690 [Polyangiales bacterium]
MPSLSARLSPLLALAFVACSTSSDRQFTDEACYSDAIPPPWATLVDLAIFDELGQPVCATAQVTGQQGREPSFSVPRLIGAHAVLRPDGHHALVAGDSCNAYNGLPGGGPEGRPLFRCSDPLNWSVTAEGCEPAHGSWSWNDNTFPGRVDISFHITVRLRCHGTSDAGDAAVTDAASD